MATPLRRFRRRVSTCQDALLVHAVRALGKRYGVERLCGYDDLDELLGSGEVDASYVALPNSMHEEYTLRAARAGVHVLCEKPMAVTADECRRMIGATREAGVKLMIAYRLHFERANIEVAELVRGRKLGDVRFFDSQFCMQVKAGNIRVQRSLGGGPLYDIGIYCINAARYLFAAEPTEAWATAVDAGDARFRDVPETVAAALRFPDERIATFTVSFNAGDRSALEVVGTRGSVRMDPAYEFAEGNAYEVTLGERKRRKQFRKSDQFAPELLHFSDCVLHDREPEPSGEEGLIDVQIIEALHRSIASGRWEKLVLRERRRRPTRRQEIRRPGVDMPDLMHAEVPQP